MVRAVGTIAMSDLSGQKRLDARIGEDGLTSSHTVGQAVEYYLDRVGIPDHGLAWTAFSRGIQLDSKQALESVDETDAEWVVLPQVSAG